MGPIRNPNWSTSGMRVTLSYLALSNNNSLTLKRICYILAFLDILQPSKSRTLDEGPIFDCKYFVISKKQKCYSEKKKPT